MNNRGAPGWRNGPDFLHVGVQAPDERLGVVGDGGAVAVTGDEVLGPHPRAVGRVPPERGGVHRGGHTPPHHRVLEPGLAEDLRHLGDVAEHVREVADLHHPAEGRAPSDAGLQVADDRLARDEELVHEDVPGPDGEPPGCGQGTQALFVLGPDGQVVIDDRHLPIEQELGEGRVTLEQVEQAVDETDQFQPEGLERVVPLTVPVGVGDDIDLARPGAGAAHGARGPCSASYFLSSSMSRVCSLAVAGVPRPAASA